ncbi:MAG: hypothetical protein SVV03_00295 [Candidatus Nanohaloarchaea archaeon]|nr:hypothetical protein [Candidatus Nanohaloarchaea archaeon]
MLSLGAVELLELYLHRIDLMKPGARLKHDWFKKKKERIKNKLKRQITGNLEDIPELDTPIDLVASIEDNRDDVAYGSPLKDDELLQECIDDFLELKELVESETGDIVGQES